MIGSETLAIALFLYASRSSHARTPPNFSSQRRRAVGRWLGRWWVAVTPRQPESTPAPPIYGVIWLGTTNIDSRKGQGKDCASSVSRICDWPLPCADRNGPRRTFRQL